MSSVTLHRWVSFVSCTRKIIWNQVNCKQLSYLIELLDTYIQCGHIWHRNKLSCCQLEHLVSCSDDEHQTSLKLDSSSHPVAPECRVSHTLRLKHFTVNVLSPSELCSCTFNIPAAWQAGVTVRSWRPKNYPEGSNFVTKTHRISPSWSATLFLTHRKLSSCACHLKTIFAFLF